MALLYKVFFYDAYYFAIFSYSDKDNYYFFFKINVHTYFFNIFNSFFTQLKRAKEELGRRLHHY